VIHTVGVADMKVSTKRDDLIITHALGSCLGVTVYDRWPVWVGCYTSCCPFLPLIPARRIGTRLCSSTQGFRGC